MARERALVGNAGSERQVRRAARTEREIETRRRESMRLTLQSVHGRATIWSILEDAGLYRSVMDQSGSRVFYNAGRQDFAHELLAMVLDVDENLYMTMEQEARAFKRREDMKADAEHKASVENGENDDEP